MIRSSFITYASDEISSPDILDSLAKAMRHSTTQQKRTYDRRTYSQRISKGVKFTSKTIESIIPTITNDTCEETPTIVTGEMVALLDNDSTRSSPKVLFAKILRINCDTKSALLNQLVEFQPGMYKLKIGAGRWEAKLMSLIPGIDFQFTNGGYQLRTNIDDIVEQFYS